jgi:hypothetical protein
VRVLLLLLLLALAALGASPPDPGVVLQLDRERFELLARDLRDGAAGPRLRVALGSPAHPTPGGSFAPFAVIENPAWIPGPVARGHGAIEHPPSTEGPLGAVKIPFAAEGAVAIHGAADPRLLGKPVSLGCVRATDADLLALVAWLDSRAALGPPRPRPDGELHRTFVRPARVVVR